MEMTTPTPETLRAIRPCPLCGRWDGTHREGCQWSAAADAWERTLKIVEARPDDPYPDEELGLSEDAHQWVQEIWRTARIHQADAIKLRARLAEAEKVRFAAQLKRCVIIHDDPKFIGRWVAVPEEDFDALRAALAHDKGPAVKRMEGRQAWK